MHIEKTAEPALALWLADHAAQHGLTAFIARSDTQLDRFARACAGFCAGRIELLTLPPWDVLPYDRTAPDPAIVGRRVATLTALAIAPTGPRLLLTDAAAVMQRVPPPSAWDGAGLWLRPGDDLDLPGFRTAMGERGYHLGEIVRDPGEVAIHGQVIDIFPGGDRLPVRLELDGDRIAALQVFDPTSQRSLERIDAARILPVVEFPLDPEEAERALEQDETPMAMPSGRLVPAFDYLRGFALIVDDAVDARWAALREQADEAYQMNRRLVRSTASPGVLPRPERLFLSVAQANELCAEQIEPTLSGVAEDNARRASELIRRAQHATTPVVIATSVDVDGLTRSLARRGLQVRAATDWLDAVAGGVACLTLDLDAGFAAADLLVLQAGHLVRSGSPAASQALRDGPSGPGIGDIVVHLEHGAARLVGLKSVATDDVAEERVALAFAGDTEMLVEPSELNRIWRYGTTGSLDRIDGEAWRTKRAELEAEIEQTARALAKRAALRARRPGPAMEPDRAGYDRLARRFPYALSVDQDAAVRAVLDDLRRGSPPMDRLVCGDVGFGKTEVALRAAAAVALSDYQVAVVAPTTVLARQHFEVFRRRFTGSDVRVELLLASVPQAHRRGVLSGLKDGKVGIVVGTQAVAADMVRFARLGLVIIDEEQRFGEAQKQALTGQKADAAHILTMTATPIPRTLQSALIGLREVSVIATAPMRRQPTRSFVLDFDPLIVREALLREHTRGGQSFVVCPRIADLAQTAAQLADLVPDLVVTQAHGRMKPEVLEAAVMGFADGAGDVLLATNIIEAGIDIPRANTIAVMHADRFGLAQLHQLRGRVGRGSRRGAAYLFTEPGRRLAASTRARLRAIEQLGGLGAGVAISAADLDQRGAGDLFGEAQAGHVSALGTDLYEDLLVRAIRQQNGEAPPPPAPDLHIGLSGRIPDTLVPEPDLRLSLYDRLARLTKVADIDDFADELEDRFGEAPPDLAALLTLARLRCLCAGSGVARLEAGPRGAAFKLYDTTGLADLADRLGGVIQNDRIVVEAQIATGNDRAAWLVAMLGG